MIIDTNRAFRFAKKCLRRSCKYFYVRRIEKCESVNYLHILGHCELKFNKTLVEEINISVFPFKKEEHLFITPHWDVYFALKKYDNVYFVSKWNAERLNQLAYLGEWIFFHSLNFDQNERSKILETVASRIIWRTWGHDIINYKKYICEEINPDKKEILKKSYAVIRRFYAIGGGNEIDLININESIGSVKFFRMPYSFDNIPDEFKMNKERKSGPVRILVGHYASRGDRLLECLAKLIKFKNEDIQIYLITSYADNDREYVNEVRKFAIKNFGNKVVFIDQFLPKMDYIRFLQSIDIALMDQIGSAALGNIAWLVYFDKKIFLNRTGIIKKAFDIHNIVYRFTDEIESISYEEFIEPVNNSNLNRHELQVHDRYDNLKCWEKLFEELRNQNI